MTPQAVHYAAAEGLQQQRTQTLQEAFLANPQRFKGVKSLPPYYPSAAWINPSKKESAATSHIDTCSLIS